MIDDKMVSSYNNSEILRKVLHFSFILLPISYYFISQSLMFKLTLALAITLVTIDVGRHFNDHLRIIFYKYCSSLMRKSERDTITGASFMLIASCIIIGLFPKIIAITSLAVLSVSDALAALVGKYYGRVKIQEKTLEGSLAFLFSGIIIVFIIKLIYNFNSQFILHGSVAVFIGMIVEFFSKKIKIDDNFLIPLTVAVVLELLTR